MDHVRYLLGVLVLIVYAPGLLFWLVIHPWAHGWRVLGLPRTYFIVFSMLAVVSVLLFQVRRTLLGTDLGTNWILIGAGILFYGILAWLGSYGRHASHLSFAVRIGVPELSCSDGQILVEREFIEWCVILCT
jgi:hypothetical protein